MEQHENDWRMHLYTHVAEDWVNPWTGAKVNKGAQVTFVSVIQVAEGKNLTIAVPDATALFLNISARSWNKAGEVRKRSGIDGAANGDVKFSNNGEAFDYLDRVITSVMMAFSGLEAFVNEMIPDDYCYETKRKSKKNWEVMNKTTIERQLSLTEKLASVLPDALRTESPKGKDCWEDFVRLRKTRDRITHMKTTDRKSSGPDNPNLWHDLFRVSCPYQQSLKMIDFFLREANVHPQWREAWPLQ